MRICISGYSSLPLLTPVVAIIIARSSVYKAEVHRVEGMSCPPRPWGRACLGSRKKAAQCSWRTYFCGVDDIAFRREKSQAQGGQSQGLASGQRAAAFRFQESHNT